MSTLKLLGAIFLSLLGYISTAQQMAKGYIYYDANHNQKKDAKEKGIKDVAVSNGEAVVLTNDKGWYQLPVQNDQTIFVIKPATYQLPLNKNLLPQFYYHHKPMGSPPGGKYSGVAPTGPLPKLLNFGLLKDTITENFTALVFGDPQPSNEWELEQFKKGIVQEVAGIKQVALGISLGDLVGNKLNLQPAYATAIKEVGVPWYNVMGNHDMNMEAENDSVSDETFELNFGPATYSFNVGKVHVIILDDIIYPYHKKANEYIGGFTTQQLQFIKNDLQFVPKDFLVVLAMHIPLNNHKTAFRLADRKKLFALLKTFPNCLLLSAHTHLQRNDFLTSSQDWLQPKPLHEFNVGTTSGDWYSGRLNDAGIPASTMRDGTPKGYALIKFMGNQYKIEYKVAGMPADYQIALYCPKVISTVKNTASFYANFFMGSAQSEVFYNINNGPWQKMNYHKNMDPSYLAELINWDFSDSLMMGRRPSNAVACTHLWKADFSKKMKAGKHLLTVKVTDRYGKTHIAKKYFMVQRPK